MSFNPDQVPTSKPDLFYILAALNFDGQETQVSEESLATSDFELVSKILSWFVRILDDESELGPPGDTSSQEEEIQFLIEVGRFFIEELGIKLNLIALYEADINSVPELLKIAQPIYEAAEIAVSAKLAGDDGKISSRLEESSKQVEIARKQLINDLLFLNSISQSREQGAGVETREKNNQDHKVGVEDDAKVEKDYEPGRGGGSKSNSSIALQMQAPPDDVDDGDEADQLTRKLAALASDLELLLSQEERLARERLGLMDRNYDLDQIRQVLSDSFEDILSKTKELNSVNKGLELDLLRLDERLQSKESEIEESKQRLSELLVESPSYYKEHERLRAIYEEIYDGWVARYRCFTYLKWSVYSSESKPDAERSSARQGLLDGTAKPRDELKRRDQLELAEDAGRPPAPRELSATVGPARLLESLAGASNPRSASDSGAASATATGGAGLTRAATEELEAGSAAGRRSRYEGDKSGLELEVLLNEFVAESELAGAGSSGLDNEELDGEIDP